MLPAIDSTRPSSRPTGPMLRALAIAILALAAAWPIATRAGEVLVFAAASLKPALDGILATPDAQAIGSIDASYAASSQLARQIEHGAPAALFISADVDWMDHLENLALIDGATRTVLVGNTLVLVAPSDSDATVDLTGGDLVAALGNDGRLAIAEPNSVPAGKYAKAALGTLGLWPAVDDRLVAAINVRAALAFVARGEAPLGIVYRSDALSEPAVREVAAFPADSHPAIEYPVAIVTANDSPAARRLLALLRSEATRALLLRHGFSLPPGASASPTVPQETDGER